MRLLNSRAIPTARGVLFPALALAAVLLAACAERTPVETPTAAARPTVAPTAPPSVQDRAEVRRIFTEQIELIQARDWEAIYQSCTVDFRNRRDLDTFITQAEQNFFRQGYSYDGFEVRNVAVTTEPRNRVSVTYDAYENGQFIRTVTPDGGAYVRVRGEWVDDGINCRTSNRPAILP